MTFEEAKNFYFKYLGKSFHMGREESWKYDEFRKLNLLPEQYREWDEELLSILFAKLWEDTDETWLIHENINSVLQRGYCDYQVNCNLLLDEMEKMNTLDEKNRILIIENMAGRNGEYKDGICRLVCTYTDLEKKMNEVVHKIASVPVEFTPDRFEQALNRYEDAFKRFKKAN